MFNRTGENPSFLHQCCIFFQTLLSKLTSKLNDLQPNEFDKLTTWRSPTIRFPLAVPEYTADSEQRFDRFHSYILPMRKREWLRIYDDTNLNFEPVNQTPRFSFEFQGTLSRLQDDDWLVLKVCGALLSGGWYDPNKLRDFFRIIEKISISQESRLYKLIAEQLYIGVYSIAKSTLFVSLSHAISPAGTARVSNFRNGGVRIVRESGRGVC